MNNPNNNTSPADPMREAREALEDPSTRVVQWHGNTSGEPTVTVLITRSGARLPAQVFRGHTLIVTDETGGKTATNFSTAVKLPEYNAVTGKFGQGGEKVKVWSASKLSSVGEDLVIGDPLGGGPRITQVSVEGGALAESHGLVSESTLAHMNNPDAHFNLPDPTFAADEFIVRAQHHFTAANV